MSNMEAKDFKVNHDLGKSYILYVRIKGEEEICDMIYNQVQLMEFRNRVVENGVAEQFEFFVDFESKDFKPINDDVIITLNKKGEASRWPYLPMEDPDIIVLGIRTMRTLMPQRI